MSRLTEKQLLILTIATAALLTGGLGFLIWSDLQAVDEEEQTIADLRSQIDAAETEIKQIPNREHLVISDRLIADKEVAFLPEASEIETFWEVLQRFAEESGVRISEIAPNQVRTRGRKKKSTIEQVVQIMSLRGTAEEFLRFLNLVENYDRIINVGQYSIQAGEAADADGKTRHAIKLALTTFTYNRKIANTIVSIPNYEKKKEHPEVKKILSQIKIQEKETYTLRTSLTRRDPFENVRRKIEKAVEASPEDELQQKAMLENLIEQIRTLQDGLEIEDHLRKIKDLWRLSQQVKENRALFQQMGRSVDQVEREKLITISALQERFRSEVLEPFREIQKRLTQDLDEEPRRTLDEVKAYLQRAQKAFDDQDWTGVEKIVREFNDISRSGDWVEEDARGLVVEIRDLLRRTDVIRKFARRKILISTILYSPNAMSIAVINGKQVGEGDALDGDGQVIVAEIGENYVIFETEGVEIKRGQGERTGAGEGLRR